MEPMKRTGYCTALILCIFLLTTFNGRAQDSLRYSLGLQDVVTLAIEQSADLKYAQNSMSGITGGIRILKHIICQN